MVVVAATGVIVLQYGVVGVDLAKPKGCRLQVKEVELVNFCCQPSKHCAVLDIFALS